VRDNLGLHLSGSDPDSLEHYERGLGQFQCYVGDPLAAVDTALGQRPDFVMAHVLRAYLHLLGTEPEGLVVAQGSLEQAQALAADARERGHLAAIEALLGGQWARAGLILEDVAIEYPQDVLALQAGHQVDFFSGHSRMLRDRIARALPRWQAGMPGYHAVLGMYAFGLEENGDYVAAEACGRTAVELQPRDGWAQHAVAHVLEMQNRQREGVAWMRGNQPHWTGDSFFQGHNWWHLALYYLDLGEIDEVLALFDGPIFGARSGLALDLVDAAALLWRLHLQGVELGTRWQAVADGWAALGAAGQYAFNDAHAMMAFVGAGRVDAAAAVLEAQLQALGGTADNRRFSAEVGQPLCLALRAFGDGDYRRCVDLLRPIRSIAQRFGGSHAQRDLLDLTLLEAALRGGELALGRALAAERLQAKPHNGVARRYSQRAEALAG
jgi:tetratricopeptide (TPR) repeat protein